MSGHSYAAPEDLLAFWEDGEELIELGDAAAARLLSRASEDVDTLTYGRITDFDALTPFQQETVRAVVCQLAVWLHDYGEAAECPASAYAINGVSVTMDSGKTVQVQGVTIPRRLYRMLCRTGLCYGGLA